MALVNGRAGIDEFCNLVRRCLSYTKKNLARSLGEWHGLKGIPALGKGSGCVQCNDKWSTNNRPYGLKLRERDLGVGRGGEGSGSGGVGGGSGNPSSGLWRAAQKGGPFAQVW